MASKGQKGVRDGGRSAGTPNKATTERVEQARVAVEQAKGRGVKLGKEMLEDYMMAFHAVAAVFQNKIATSLQQSQPPAAADLAGFQEWGGLVVSTAKSLADFQSPRFRAIMVQAAPGENAPRDVTPGSNVVQLKDPVAMSRAYQQLVKRVG